MTTTVYAVCVTCSAYRYKSIRPLGRGDAMMPEDFEPMDGAPAPEAGKPMVCHVCKGNLSIRRAPEHAGAPTNGAPASPPSGGGPAGVQTLFALGDGEEIRQTRDVTQDIIVIVTNKRIVRVNLADLAMEVVRASR